MSGLTRRPLSPPAAGRHARLRRSADLRDVCLTTLIALVVQFVVGMILNLYVTVPSADTHAGYIQEMLNGPVSLTVHVLLGIVLVGAAVLLLIRAIGRGNRVLASLAATGLAAILGAFAAGETFVRNGQANASLWMAILTAVALVSYIGALNLIRVTDAATQPASNASQPAAPAGQRSDDFWSAPGTGSPFPATGPHPHSRTPTAQHGFASRDAASLGAVSSRGTSSSRGATSSRGTSRGAASPDGWAMTPPPMLPYRKPPTDDFPRVATDNPPGKAPW
jgi:lysylphosphatidylglycerol synthetase-like protein (DUF2156 family)